MLTRDELLDNLMLYWLPGTGASAARLYWESIRQVNQWISGQASDTIDIPAGCSVFPKELQRPSRRWAARRFTNIVYWNEPPRGGHFAAFEQPEQSARSSASSDEPGIRYQAKLPTAEATRCRPAMASPANVPIRSQPDSPAAVRMPCTSWIKPACLALFR